MSAAHTPLAERLRELADYDARAGEPLGKCMREAAETITELLEALEPFAAALLKADDQERRMVEAGMGAMSDNTKISWGIKRKDLRSAAAAIAKARGEA